jgi:hypothetical protein
MKLFSKFALIFFLIQSSITFARDIVLIENQSSKEEGEIVKKILNQKYKIPEELIKLKDIESKCTNNTEAIIHLCIDRNGELNVERMNKFVVKNALEFFMGQSVEQE